MVWRTLLPHPSPAHQRNYYAVSPTKDYMAQFVEHRTSNAEVTGLNPIPSKYYFYAIFKRKKKKKLLNLIFILSKTFLCPIMCSQSTKYFKKLCTTDAPISDMFHTSNDSKYWAVLRILKCIFSSVKRHNWKSLKAQMMERKHLIWCQTFSVVRKTENKNKRHIEILLWKLW